MEEHGVKFIREWIPTSVKKIKEGTPPTLLVTAKEAHGDATMEIEVNTILFAMGRNACTKELGLENANVKLSK